MLVILDAFTFHIPSHPRKQSVSFQIVLKSLYTFISSKIHSEIQRMFKTHTHTQIWPPHSSTLHRSLEWLPIHLRLFAWQDPLLPTSQAYLGPHYCMWPPPMPPSSFCTIDLFAKPTKSTNEATPQCLHLLIPVGGGFVTRRWSQDPCCVSTWPLSHLGVFKRAPPPPSPPRLFV